MNALAAMAVALDPELTSAAPILNRADLSCRPARLSDVFSGWFAYWARELGLAATPDTTTWRAVVLLQALYERNLLRAGARVSLDAEADAFLGKYLRDHGLRVVDASDLPADGVVAARWPPASDTISTEAQTLLHLGSFAFAGAGSDETPNASMLEIRAGALRAAGWTVGELAFDLGDHPLDAYVALVADDIPLGGAPRLRFATEQAMATPYLIIADRRG